MHKESNCKQQFKCRQFFKLIGNLLHANARAENEK